MCGSVTRFVLIAAQIVKDYFSFFLFFSYVIGIIGTIKERIRFTRELLRVQTILEKGCFTLSPILSLPLPLVGRG